MIRPSLLGRRFPPTHARKGLACMRTTRLTAPSSSTSPLLVPATGLRPVVLVIDDEPGVRASVRMVLDGVCEVMEAADGPAGIELVRSQDVDVCLLDVRLPGMEGIEVLERLKRIDPGLEVVLVTAVRTVRTAVEAMKLGAYDYLTKPFGAEDLRGIVGRAVERRALHREVRYLRDELARHEGFDKLVGRSEVMRRVYERVRQVADTTATVLITGESGTGKELIARAIHRQGTRRDRPFVAVNCAALPADLLESELFGHERGAFTGAHARKLGKFEVAHTGTLFLDEIGTLRLDLQPKLLRALQEREIERVGGSRPVPVDVRVIAATNVNLRQAVRDRTFRDDLFYRLNVVPIHVPPLRERREDIPHLVEHFVRRTARECSRDVRAVSAGALDALVRYDWPGNVRELDNVIYRAVVLAREPVLQLSDFPLDVVMPEARVPAGDDAGLPLREACDRFERQYVLRVLERSQWNVSRAARLLGVHRNTILTKLTGWGVQRPGAAAAGDQALSL